MLNKIYKKWIFLAIATLNAVLQLTGKPLKFKNWFSTIIYFVLFIIILYEEKIKINPMKDIFYTQIAVIIIITIVFCNYQFNFFDPEVEKYLLFCAFVVQLLAIIKLRKILKNKKSQ